jgi:hypothetical protein
MAARLPYFRWFPADAETDEIYTRMSDTALGFYHRCLNKAWINNGLPANEKELSELMKVSIPYLRKQWIIVGKKFEPRPNDGRLINGRQEREREKVISKSVSASGAVRTRYERRSNESTNELPRARARPDSASDSEVDSEERNVAPAPTARDFSIKFPGFGNDPTFEPFIEEYVRSGKPLIEKDFIEAHWKWRKMDFEQRAAAIASIKLRNETGFYSDPSRVHLPGNFLAGEYKRQVNIPTRKTASPVPSHYRDTREISDD